MKFITNFYLLFTLTFFISCNPDINTPIETIKLCNNSAFLCAKKYNETVFACTHNAYNYPTKPTNFILNNQNQSIQQQLNDGISALMLDLYYADDEESILLYHGTSLAGSNALDNELTIVKNYLDNNTTGIITLILECYVTFPDFKKAIEKSGLAAYLYNPKPSGEWPLLQDMIDANERLVILTDVKDLTADDWYIYMWDVAFETHYSNKSSADFSCDSNRGNTKNDLFIFNHFITQSIIGTGLVDSSAIVNQYDFLLNRLSECQTHHTQMPNFVTVDFYDRGNVIEVVNYLNEL